MSDSPELELMWARHSAEWRDCAQICSSWREAQNVDPRLLQLKASRAWWDLLAELRITLFVTREYEHLVVALSAPNGRPHMTFLPVPHPSGLVIDRGRLQMHIASTRNPNQVYTLRPVTGAIERLDNPIRSVPAMPFLPVSSTFYPGCMYMHDLALIGGSLHANAVGHNAVVRLGADGVFHRVWWPRCIEQDGEPVFGRNHIQLNSIAAGPTLSKSFFSASSTHVGSRRPGHLNYPVDRQGVIFSGRTREPICTGLTRPHSARLDGQGRIWVANSGYGELGVVSAGRLEVIQRLPGWTRGLCLAGDVAIVATSRVIPKFRRYAPGIDADASRSGLHAICARTGKIMASLYWPWGNQIFAIDSIDSDVSLGLAFGFRQRSQSVVSLFYSYSTDGQTQHK